MLLCLLTDQYISLSLCNYCLANSTTVSSEMQSKAFTIDCGSPNYCAVACTEVCKSWLSWQTPDTVCHVLCNSVCRSCPLELSDLIKTLPWELWRRWGACWLGTFCSLFTDIHLDHNRHLICGWRTALHQTQDKNIPLSYIHFDKIYIYSFSHKLKVCMLMKLDHSELRVLR